MKSAVNLILDYSRTEKCCEFQTCSFSGRLILPALFALLIVFAGCSKIPVPEQTPVEKYGQLSVKGNKVVDKNGNPVQLKGMSLFWSQEIGKYYNYSAIKWLRDDWKCTITRAAMAVENGGYLTNPELEKQKVDSAVNAALQLGMYILIDWHDHHAQRHTAQAKEFFADMAQQYGKYPNVIYELYNEPLNDVSWADSIKPYHEAVIDTIRKYDTLNIIVCGSRTWSQDVDEVSLDPIKGNNIAYSLHYYAATHKQELRDKAEVALKNGIALMVTEFGTVFANGDGDINYEESRLWWDLLDKYQISWCCWSICDKNESSAALKPGASATGGWNESMLTPSGIFIRKELRGENVLQKK
jgi:endoglucanase